jgi:predicted nucleic acid-binding protein
MKQRLSSLNIYVDTNIIRDYSERRDHKSIHLLESIRNKKWKCSSSTYSMMELCDVEKDQMFFQNTYVKQRWTVDKFLRERYKRLLSNADFQDVRKYIDNIKETLNFIGFFVLTEDGWNIALNLSMYSNLRAADCVQLATAISLKCNSFITRDDYLEKTVKSLNKETDLGEILEVFTPSSFLKKMSL